MKRLHLFSLGLGLAVSAHNALAQIDDRSAPDQARARSEALKIETPSWAKQLEKEGYLDKTASGPYRYAVPITRFGNDVDLKATYGQTVPGVERRSGLIFLRIPVK